MDINYVLSVVNSALRSTTPILLAALASAICTRSGVFNVALEGQMLIGSFVGIAVNWVTHSPTLAVLAAIVAGGLVGALVGILQVRYNAADMVVGTSVNLLVGALTAILLFVVFGVKGGFKDPALVPLPKVKLPVISEIPYLSTLFNNLSPLDYLSYVIAIVMYIYLFKTVKGYHLLSVGVKREAAESMGISAVKTRIAAVIASGCLCGYGGVALSMGQVTLFAENMTAGRGFIGMAACNLGKNNPIAIIFASLFFGFSDAFAATTQNTIPSQLTQSVPYIATILALIVFSRKRKKKAPKAEESKA